MAKGTIKEQITQIEEEIRDTPYNKATQHHIGKLKAKLARLRDEIERIPTQAKRGGFAVKKSGSATVGIVGFPSAGKSTLLNTITDAESTVASYRFTTLNIIPGVMEYKGAKIQVLDMPGLIRGASKGRGMGRTVLSVVRCVDLVLLLLDVFETNIHVLINELEKGGIRLNQTSPDIVIIKKEKGGVNVNSTVELTKIDEEMVSSILRTYSYINADIVIREDITEEQLIDYLSSNRVYIPTIAVLNKVDLVNKKYLADISKRLNDWSLLFISAKEGIGLENLKEAIFNKFKFMRIFLRPQHGNADYEEPMIIKYGSTVGMVCDTIHRDFCKKFRYANVWGRSAKFPGQTVGMNHVLADEDVLTVVVKR